MKIRNRKQVQKIADAVRLLHPDTKWMWVSRIGQVHLSQFEPIKDDTFGLVGLNLDTACQTNLVLKISVQETLVQIRGD